LISLDVFYKDVMGKFERLDDRLDDTCGSIRNVDKKISSHLAAEEAKAKEQEKHKSEKNRLFDKKTVIISLAIGIIGVVAIFK